MISARADGALGVLMEVFDKHFDHNLPSPYMCSTAVDRVHVEWTIGGCEISLEFALPSLRAEFQAVRLFDKEIPFRWQLNLDKNEDWKILNELLTDVVCFFRTKS